MAFDDRQISLDLVKRNDAVGHTVYWLTAPDPTTVNDLSDWRPTKDNARGR